LARKKGNPSIAIGYVMASKSEQELTPEVQRVAMARCCKREAVQLLEVFEDYLSGAT